MIEKIVEMIKHRSETYRDMLPILGKSDEFQKGFFAAVEYAQKIIVDASDNGEFDEENLTCCRCKQYLDKNEARCTECAKHLIDI